MPHPPDQPPLMESPPGAHTVIDGRRYLYFAGTSYFALHSHPEVIEAGVLALRKHGVHSATSRAGFGTIAPVLEVERRALCGVRWKVCGADCRAWRECVAGVLRLPCRHRCRADAEPVPAGAGAATSG